jgi:nitrogen fixation NifU-like protein
MTTLYDELILDHIRQARNYRVPERVTAEIPGSNPMCGDEMMLYLDIAAGRLQDIGFQCTCCGVSMASASIMTERVKGKRVADARALLREFTDALAGTVPAGSAVLTREQQALVEAARRSPSRARCAALPWDTLLKALAEPGDPASGADRAP